MTSRILLGLTLGVAWGLFFGEYGAWVGWIGDAFVGLLQMAILPYVAISLTSNIGRLSSEQCGRVAWVAVSLLLLLWAVGGMVLVVMSLCFPPWDAGSFFSTSLVEEPVTTDWLELFIPSNLFWSLTNNLVPAVVLFSVGLGVALISVPNKELLIETLDVLVLALGRLNNMVLRLAPLGMFGIAGHTAGTLSLEKFELLQGYLLVYALASVLITFWVLPAMVAASTPFSHREILRESRDVLITAFALGNTFIVLPMIAEAGRRLMTRHGVYDKSVVHAPSEAVQFAYPFPDIGRIVGLVFIPFAAWFYGSRIDPTSLPELIGTGFFSAFAKPVISIPLLLQLAELPSDIFNLYLASGVVASRFGDLMKTMHLLVFSLLAICCLSGTLRMNYLRLGRAAAVTAVLFLVTVMSMRSFLEYSFEDSYDRGRLIVDRQLLGEPAEAVVVEDAGPNPEPRQPGEDRMARILRRGVIRVGVDPHRLPFAYQNQDGDLVGYDIDMAHQLAHDLGVSIEFVLFPASELIEWLEDDRFDVAMGALEATVERAALLPEMNPYMELTSAFVVPDHRRREFESLGALADALRGGPPLTVAVLAGGLASETRRTDTSLGWGWGALKDYGIAPHIERVELDSARDFFESAPENGEVLATTAEEGAAWTLEYPEFAVVKPEGFNAKSPLCYFVPERSQFRHFINTWLNLKRRNGAAEQLYDYWILGKLHKDEQPRWCVVRDVLHWIE
ncbi:Cyclohexadienyl dehydratase precursor [Posidoniimonas corsicana]|uniref:Cyclohexadienyl dehydratase n=1 Tax=Posidoniimonas corsicana TaxID=1938618 RepID=A0A5C5VCX7_9BACT|nr:cation:dicarboxylase symporter family transporter [Posidoniimonas corsicana]TWT36474.1 Cyclohexadienyl dehydratase precursor [Posidoniimonas corsicana]